MTVTRVVTLHLVGLDATRPLDDCELTEFQTFSAHETVLRAEKHRMEVAILARPNIAFGKNRTYKSRGKAVN